MPKQKIERKRITKNILSDLYPELVADKIFEVANEYGNEGEMGIKSFIPQTVDTNHFWHTREGDKYIVMDATGKEASVQMVSQDVVGASDVSHKLNNKFQIPAGTFMIMVTYYKKHTMKVYTCEASEKLGPAVSEEMVAKLTATVDDPVKAETMVYAENLTRDRSTQLPDNPQLENVVILQDAVLQLPKSDSDTGEVVQAEIVERDPKVLQPRKRRTEPLKVEPVASTTSALSGLKDKSPDGDNLYHGEVVIVGIGENEGKEITATMKIGGRKWICLSGGWDYEIPTGNMKEVMGVYHTHFSRVDGSWKANKAGTGWKIREDWFEKIIETK